MPWKERYADKEVGWVLSSAASGSASTSVHRIPMCATRHPFSQSDLGPTSAQPQGRNPLGIRHGGSHGAYARARRRRGSDRRCTGAERRPGGRWHWRRQMWRKRVAPPIRLCRQSACLLPMRQWAQCGRELPSLNKRDVAIEVARKIAPVRGTCLLNRLGSDEDGRLCYLTVQ